MAAGADFVRFFLLTILIVINCSGSIAQEGENADDEPMMMSGFRRVNSGAGVRPSMPPLPLLGNFILHHDLDYNGNIIPDSTGRGRSYFGISRAEKEEIFPTDISGMFGRRAPAELHFGDKTFDVKQGEKIVEAEKPARNLDEDVINIEDPMMSIDEDVVYAGDLINSDENLIASEESTINAHEASPTTNMEDPTMNMENLNMEMDDLSMDMINMRMSMEEMQMMSSVKTVEEMSSILGMPMTDSNSTDSAISGAQNAVCAPEEVTVDLGLPKEKNVMYFPRCVRLKRCGGCCTGDQLSCQPTATVNFTLRIMRVGPSTSSGQLSKSSEPTAARLTSSSSSSRSRQKRQMTKEFYKVAQVNHTACACQCNIQEGNCTLTIHEYIPEECTCRCKNKEEEQRCVVDRSLTHYWDNDKCLCLCYIEKTCGTHQTFDPDTCSCVSNLVWRRRQAQTYR